jgi:hypothetical protein
VNAQGVEPTVTTKETFELFSQRLAENNSHSTYVIGQRHCGNIRECFTLEGQSYYHEIYGDKLSKLPYKHTPAMLLNAIMSEVSDYWFVGRVIYSIGEGANSRIAKIAKHYGATIVEDYYPPEEDRWFFLSFHGDDAFEKMAKLMWDRFTGTWAQLWGDTDEELYNKVLARSE